MPRPAGEPLGAASSSSPSAGCWRPSAGSRPWRCLVARAACTVILSRVGRRPWCFIVLLGLAYFKDCKNLSVLELGGTSVTDAGLALIEDCKNLLELDLAGTSITDEGSAHLKGHKKLGRLNLDGAPSRTQDWLISLG